MMEELRRDGLAGAGIKGRKNICNFFLNQNGSDEENMIAENKLE